MKPLPKIELRPYSEADFPLLQRHNAPDMTEYLGGPETEEKLLDRHQRYVNLKPGEAYMYVIWLDGERTGMIGYWEHESKGETVWEAGWGVPSEFQGRGIALAATLALIEKARAEGKHRYMHAYPRVDNQASNALCQKAGFELIEEMDFEYPKGNPIRCNDWRVDLEAEKEPPP